MRSVYSNMFQDLSHLTPQDMTARPAELPAMMCTQGLIKLQNASMQNHVPKITSNRRMYKV